MATTIRKRSTPETVTLRSTVTAEPSATDWPLDVVDATPIPGPKQYRGSWWDRFRRTTPAAPSPRDLVLSEVDPFHTIRSIQR